MAQRATDEKVEKKKALMIVKHGQLSPNAFPKLKGEQKLT